MNDPEYFSMWQSTVCNCNMFSNKQVTSYFVYLEKETSILIWGEKRENATYAVKTQMSQFYTGT